MAATRLILVRHGETASNFQGRYQGQLDSPLTPAGLGQARALAERLARTRFTALYSSDLGRAEQTARVIADKTAFHIRPDARLRERHLGIFQGLLAAEIEQNFPDEYRCFKSGAPDHVVPGGESTRQVLERAVICLEELASRHVGETIVVVTHGGVLSVLLRHTLGVPLEARRRFTHGNASWNVFRRETAGKWFLETWGEVSHLPQGEVDDDC